MKYSSELLLDKRLRENIDFCERALATANFPQYEVLCLYSLAGCYKEAGDAVSARDSYFKLLEMCDSKKNIIYGQPSLQEVMEDMYVSTCDFIGLNAISYSEYETYMNKIEEVRPLTDLQKGQLELIENLKNEGRDWTFNIIQLAQKYQNDCAYGATACLYSLLLIYRRQLRVSPDNINLAITNYAGNIAHLIEECILYCEENKRPCNPYNYLFVVEKAINLISEYQNDMNTKEEANSAIEQLTLCKNELEQLQQKAVMNHYKYTAPGYLSPQELENEILIHEKMPINEPPPPKEQMVAIWHLISCGVFVYVGLSADKTWVIILSFIIAFYCAIGTFAIYAARHIKRKKSKTNNNNNNNAS
jgi:hypothetical protein